MMNKAELKYLLENEIQKNENLIDIVGKNTLHIQSLYSDLKTKEHTVTKLLARLNEKREEVYKLKEIIRSQSEKKIAETFYPESVDN